MINLDVTLTAHRKAVQDLIAAAERSKDVWQTARAPGKWSPSQVVEHVARSLDEAANVLAGRPSKFPTLPVFLRPLMRGLFFTRVLRKNRFPKARTNAAMNPSSGPATPADGRDRLEHALGRFDEACRTSAGEGRSVVSETFGVVAIADYARFMELHTRHHLGQVSQG